MKRITAVAVIAIAICMVLASQAYASTLTWNLVDVQFENNETATGSFTYNADTKVFDYINIVTSVGTTFVGTTYMNAGSGNDIFLDFRSTDSDSGAEYKFSTPLIAKMTNAGGSIDLNVGSIAYEFLCNDQVDNQNCNSATSLRQITGGSIVASPVPVPAALPLMLSALGIFGYLGRRKKRQTAV